ncbi:MAG: aromatic amino acid hydroxylase, partial [Chromatocurvus sp.]
MSLTQQDIIASLPGHLQPFARVQDHATQYTRRDHALWRFLMRRLTRSLASTAHPVYLEGLQRTGVSLRHIPSIDAMNESLAQLGWSAIVVDGFIPPAIFMEFQARRVLVIALDMRDEEHTEYTPAPDILHEAAGHAPFIVDVDYAEFLQRFGEVGMRAIANQHDFDVYNAVRTLSDLKATRNAPADAVAEAEATLSALSASDAPPSEAALLARLHWWTVEYGLIGTPEDPKIYGAGLLSSIGESTWCMTDEVKKLPYTIEASKQDFDITKPQPQLYVTPDFAHLSSVLEEFANKMALRMGGLSGIQKLIESKNIGTVE